MEILPTSDGGPPAPRPIRARDRWRVAWHGHRDARLGRGGGLARPYIESLRAEAEAGQRAVSAWLHESLVPVDREAVLVLTLLDQYHRDPAVPPDPVPDPAPPPAEPDSGPSFAIPDWVVQRRRAAKAKQEYLRRVHERNKAEQRLGQLGNVRHHLIETARAAASAHLARYDQLVALYETAFLRHPHHADVRSTAPSVTPEPWLYGDMPLLALKVDGDLSESYRWFLKEFETRTSVLDQPIPAARYAG